MARSTKKTKKTKKKGPFTGFPEPLNTVLSNALRESASDIHLDTLQGGVLLRFRVDGIIHEKEFLDPDVGQRLLNQIKVAANLKIDRAFSPMESQIEVRYMGGKKDLRVTLIPTGKDLAVHLRFISAPMKELDIANLGFTEENQKKIQRVLKSPSGLILVSGRTGAGKTTTLYSLASLLDLQSTIVVSIENPVEFNLPGLRQLEVGEHRNLTVQDGLRIFLRMDPDVIFVGEVRDKESAIATAQAALSGRLVIATIHAQNATRTVERMHHLGVPYYIIGGILSLIISQNLVRRLCSSCAKPRMLKKPEKELFIKNGLPVPGNVLHPVGCDQCNSYGYSGLTGLFEIATIDEETGNAIGEGLRMDELGERFRKNGINSALTDGLKKVAAGITSLEELIRTYWPFGGES